VAPVESSTMGHTAAQEIVRRIEALGDPKRAVFVQGYFKTGPGEYGEGDRFVGIPVPEIRKLARQYRGAPLEATAVLLRSSIHEARLLALLILCDDYARGDVPLRERIFGLYLDNTRFINNWDLVDASAPNIVGPHLLHGNRAVLRTLAVSAVIWERRIAIMATLHFIRQGEFGETLDMSRMLLDDREDLIHKAVGWMLREVGKRDQAVLETFLKVHYKRMPRTMLRYAIERFPEDLRKRYLKGEV
jgi:3-methyladenine DNA glycosylase AlkD